MLDTRQPTLDGWAPANDGTTVFAAAAQRLRDRRAERKGRRGDEAALTAHNTLNVVVAQEERIRRSNARAERRRGKPSDSKPVLLAVRSSAKLERPELSSSKLPPLPWHYDWRAPRAARWINEGNSPKLQNRMLPLPQRRNFADLDRRSGAKKAIGLIEDLAGAT